MNEKGFDCVRMKHEIQQQLEREMRGLSEEERRRWTEEQIRADPILRAVWERSRRIEGAGLVSKK